MAVRFLIEGVSQRLSVGGRENACPHTEDPPVVIQTPYPADLDPLDRTPDYLFWNLLDLNAKDPSAWCLRGLIECDIRGMSECDLRETYDVKSDLGSG